MKKILLYVGIALLVLIIGFSSCSSDTDDITNEPTPTVTTTTNETAKPTVTPTTAAKPNVTPGITPTHEPENDADMVWVTKNGKKYHSKSNCSNMKSPYQMTEDDAIKSGRSACSKCY